MIDNKNGINSKTFDLLLGKDKFKIREKTKSAKEEALKTIELFTLLSDEEEDEYLYGYSDIVNKDGTYFYVGGRRQYMFDRMDKYSNPEDASKLRTKDRYGLCCPESMRLAFERNKGGKVVIGYIHYTEKKIIHAVYEEDGIVYDYTKNLVMMSHDYYNLTDFEELNTVTRKELQSDYEYIHKYESIPLKLYLIFRDEFMRDLKKNKKVLKIK
ncbi:MAG: hypothetical protein IJH20_02940 [Bacilli bacterium]|nr:hypothetical protein [Bacilli bacterium]